MLAQPIRSKYYRCAHSVLSLLDLEVVEKRGQHVVRTDGLGDVTKGVDGGSSDSFLVGLKTNQR